MMLGELIEFLKTQDQSLVLKQGFESPHSDRGYYQDVAFEPCEDVDIQSMLKHAESALGAVFTGYKGGEYLMGEFTDCWRAEYGCTGDEISKLWLAVEIELATLKRELPPEPEGGSGGD